MSKCLSTKAGQVHGDALLDAINGFITADMTQAKGQWGELGVILRYLASYMHDAAVNLFNMIVMGQNAQGSFAWLNWVRDAFEFLRAKIAQVIEILKPFYNFMNGITQLFGGLQFGTLLLVLALLRMSGALGLIVRVGGLVMSMIGLRAAVTAAGAAAASGFAAAVTAGGGFSAGMSLTAAFGLLGTSLTATIPLVWAAIAPWLVWVAAITALIAAFIILPPLIAKAIDAVAGWFGQSTEQVRTRDDAAFTAQENKMWQDRKDYAAAHGLEDPDVMRDRVSAQLKAAQTPTSQGGGPTGYQGIDNLMANLNFGGQADPSQALAPVNINFQDKNIAQLQGQADQIESMLNSEYFSQGN